MIKAVIFDMDGLLFDTELLYSEGLIYSASKCGIDMSIEETYHVIGKTTEDAREFYAEYYKDNPKIDGRILVDEQIKYVENILKTVGSKKKPFVDEVLQFLKDNDYKIGLASSGRISDIYNNLEKHGLEHFFDAIASGEEVELGKPNPDVFLLAARKLNIEPKNCLVLEDSLNGVIGANRAGMKSIMIPDLIEPNEIVLSMVEFVGQNLADVILFLKKK
ncbi:MAG: HAD family phosphatase [Peptostreptococcus porci]|uniref:HAD family phosphatase n=1 Tax=Peptostreptococcus porci TaxID=2652282 RepID=A0A6N7XE81_9FIRM|nr:HAD family phosphatase [Peptostreptococcus porci]MDY2794709.1 HAD family phosphatase [Peptostreptococcus porci]MDY4561614.1 HAD family phosphatase [Peptostreptococcus porci]MDY5479899.1 HAD family phosphatase [Peptostreptococcus porci]MST62652.1 HAD family phosphatase [Peptostreptococcus porci]